MKAQDTLKAASEAISSRAAARDVEQERSMKRCVAAFNALTGHKLSERDGWLFMVTLKAARATTTATGIEDDYVDLAAYAALAGETVVEKKSLNLSPGMLAASERLLEKFFPQVERHVSKDRAEQECGQASPNTIQSKPLSNEPLSDAQRAEYARVYGDPHDSRN